VTLWMWLDRGWLGPHSDISAELDQVHHWLGRDVRVGTELAPSQVKRGKNITQVRYRNGEGRSSSNSAESEPEPLSFQGLSDLYIQLYLNLLGLLTSGS